MSMFPFVPPLVIFVPSIRKNQAKTGIESYFRGLRDEFDRFSPNREVSTIFIGGGTPGLAQS